MPATDPGPEAVPSAEVNLDAMQAEIISELEPLIEGAELPPEEKFDTLLRIIRTRDDKNLLPIAKVTAGQIGDPSRQAEAYTDLLKEIDYFKQAA
jgi:hypothetical protein